MSAYNHEKSPLPENYNPTEYDVVVGKGKKHYLHPGNIMLRTVVSSMLAEYSKANTKAGKSEIISDVVEHVNLKGAFIKRGDSGKWVYAEDRLCREKCSQTFRDALHETYRSSSVAKKNKRRREQDGGSVLDETPSLLQADKSSRENKRMRTMEPAPVSIPSNLYDFDFSMPEAPMKYVPTRRTSLGAGNGDLVTLLTEMLALPPVEDDSNPFEPTPICEQQDSTPIFGMDEFPAFVSSTGDKDGDFEGYPPLDCENSFAWFKKQGESQSELRNVAAAFAA